MISGRGLLSADFSFFSYPVLVFKELRLSRTPGQATPDCKILTGEFILLT